MALGTHPAETAQARSPWSRGSSPGGQRAAVSPGTGRHDGLSPGALGPCSQAERPSCNLLQLVAHPVVG